MAKYVNEIINPELFSVKPTETASNALLGLLAMRITIAPVLGDGGKPIGVVSLRDLLGQTKDETVADRMTKTVRSITGDKTVQEAGRQMANEDLHHLIAVDNNGRALGVVSSLDVLRATFGIPVRYPDAFPHADREGLIWTDPTPLDLDHAEAAPNAPGLLVLIRGEANQRELPLWAECTHNVRTRVHELLSVPQTETPSLASILDQESSHLRFRASAVSDVVARTHGLERARREVLKASLPKPKGTA